MKRPISHDLTRSLATAYSINKPNLWFFPAWEGSNI